MNLERDGEYCENKNVAITTIVVSFLFLLGALYKLKEIFDIESSYGVDNNVSVVAVAVFLLYIIFIFTRNFLLMFSFIVIMAIFIFSLSLKKEDLLKEIETSSYATVEHYSHLKSSKMKKALQKYKADGYISNIELMSLERIADEEIKENYKKIIFKK